MHDRNARGNLEAQLSPTRYERATHPKSDRNIKEATKIDRKKLFQWKMSMPDSNGQSRMTGVAVIVGFADISDSCSSPHPCPKRTRRHQPANRCSQAAAGPSLAANERWSIAHPPGPLHSTPHSSHPQKHTLGKYVRRQQAISIIHNDGVTR